MKNTKYKKLKLKSKKLKEKEEGKREKIQNTKNTKNKKTKKEKTKNCFVLSNTSSLWSNKKTTLPLFCVQWPPVSCSSLSKLTSYER